MRRLPNAARRDLIVAAVRAADQRGAGRRAAARRRRQGGRRLRRSRLRALRRHGDAHRRRAVLHGPHPAAPRPAGRRVADDGIRGSSSSGGRSGRSIPRRLRNVGGPIRARRRRRPVPWPGAVPRRRPRESSGSSSRSGGSGGGSSGSRSSGEGTSATCRPDAALPARERRCGSGGGLDRAVDVGVGVGQAREQGLEGAGGDVDAVVEQVVEVRRVAALVGALGRRRSR